MKRITQADFIGAVSLLPGAQPATLITRTDARLKKTGNSFGAVVKESKVNCIVGFNYENAVNRQQVREGAEHGAFEAQERGWGEHQGLKFIEKDGVWYLQCKIEKSLEAPRYYQVSTGRELTAEEVKPFQPAKHSSKDSQGVEKEIILRDYKLSSLLFVTIGGETYQLIAPVVEAVHYPAPPQEAPQPEPAFAAWQQ